MFTVPQDEPLEEYYTRKDISASGIKLSLDKSSHCTRCAVGVVLDNANFSGP